MALIPGNLDPMNDVEIALDASVSEQLFNKIGANINALIDLAGNYVEFTASDTWTVPENVTLVRVFGVGGGGGGGGGAHGATGVNGGLGGGGGAGAVPFQMLMSVTPGETVTITIGAGGAGGTGGVSGSSSVGTNGSAGGNTLLTATLADFDWPGARGGFRANPYNTQGAAQDGYNLTLPGYPDNGVSGAGATARNAAGSNAGKIPWVNTPAVGGGAGYDVINAGGAGGGGGSGYGAGGTGAAGTAGNFAGNPGISSTNAGGGGGGGGGGFALTLTSGNGASGGDGADGLIIVSW